MRAKARNSIKTLSQQAVAAGGQFMSKYSARGRRYLFIWEGSLFSLSLQTTYDCVRNVGGLCMM